MKDHDTVADVLARTNRPGGIQELPAPNYQHKEEGSKLALAVASMAQHSTDEGWQLMEGLGRDGYVLCGHGLPEGSTDVSHLIHRYDPALVLLQDKREWDVPPGNFRDQNARFRHVEALRDRDDVFKMTILKDSHQRPDYHHQSAEEMGCHAWVIYYHPAIVKHLAPFVRVKHLIRTYHTVDRFHVPTYSPDGRQGCLISGAVSNAYPLRQRLVKLQHVLPQTTVLKHPGYHRKGSNTPGYLKTLSTFKVAICTASIYGYALRKIIEATACGCAVITDLPADDVLPEIDGNLIRVPSCVTITRMVEIIRQAVTSYEPERQQFYVRAALRRYNHVYETKRLAEAVEQMRSVYQ